VRINCGKIFKIYFASCNVDASQFRCWSYSQYWQPELHYWIFKHDRIFWVMFSNFAAIRKTSGSGLALVTSFPSTTASKYDSKPVFSRIGRAFLLAEPSAMGWLSFRNCKIVKLLAEFHFHPYLNTINSLRFFERAIGLYLLAKRFYFLILI
jgi:hypothetical protein